MVALDDFDDEADSHDSCALSQLSFADPTFRPFDDGWCPTCESRDRLLASCLYPRHGGDGQAYRKICRCHLPGKCWVHDRWNFKVD